MNDALLELQLRKIPGVLAVATSVEAVTVLVHPEVHALVIEAQASAVALQLGDPRPVAVIGGNRPASVGGGRTQFEVVPKLRTVAPAAVLVGVAALVVGLAGSPVAWFHGLNPASSQRQQGAARLAPNGPRVSGSPGGRPSVGSPLSGLALGNSGVTSLPPSATSAAVSDSAQTAAGAGALTQAVAAGAPTSQAASGLTSGALFSGFGAPVPRLPQAKAPQLPPLSSPATLLASVGLLPTPSVTTAGGMASAARLPVITTTLSNFTVPETLAVNPLVVEQPIAPLAERADDSYENGDDGHSPECEDPEGDHDALGDAIHQAVRLAVRELAHQPAPLPAAAHPKPVAAEPSHGRGRLMAHLRSARARSGRH